MKYGMLLLMCVLLAVGCSFGERPVQSFIENPPNVLRDTAFTEYQQKLDAVESRYLSGEATYAEYVTEKKEIEEGYSRKVGRRDKIMQGE